MAFKKHDIHVYVLGPHAQSATVEERARPPIFATGLVGQSPIKLHQLKTPLISGAERLITSLMNGLCFMILQHFSHVTEEWHGVCSTEHVVCRCVCKASTASG